MTTFGFITEGVTDQIVIEYVLNGFFDTNDIDINELQPLRDETDKSRSQNYDGWTLVFEYCSSTKFKEAFQFNDYIIIQIDTDVSEEKNYDVSKRDENGVELEPADLIKKVREKFEALIGEEFFHAHEEKIIFAISVHSIECWLLPIYFNDNRKSKIVNCLGTLNREIGKKEKFTIDPKNKNADYYDAISKTFRKHETLNRLCKENPSFNIFIEEIQKRNISVETDDG